MIRIAIAIFVFRLRIKKIFGVQLCRPGYTLTARCITAKQITDLHFFARKMFKGEENADRIITGNTDHFCDSSVTDYSPDDFASIPESS